MLLLTKVVLSLMVGFITSVIFGFVLIPFLKKINFGQRISDYVGENHHKKEGTPTMGGIIFIVPTIITIIYLCLSDRVEFTYNLAIVLVVFILYALLGFLDDFISIKRKHNEGLTIAQKFLGQVLIALIFFFIFMKYDGNTNFTVSSLGIDIDLGWGYGIFILLLLVGFSNAVNLTDGLDGLAGGLSAISFVAFALISLFIGQEDMGIFCFILVGTIAGFLMFNAYPARIFMGDTGSLALGGVLATIAILTRREITLFIICLPFVIETASSMIQILYYKLTKKRVFLNSPLHHHFEKLGYQEPDKVKAFWLFGILCSLAGIYFAVWL